MRYFVFKIFFIFILLLAGTGFILAVEEEECGTISWHEYRCTDGCQGKIQRRIITECDCGGGRHYGSWITIKNCRQWQKCFHIGPVPECKCVGECIRIPQNPRYFNNPNFPTNPKYPEESLPNTNILLPVKLDWDDVPGWITGWNVEKCEEECVQSYRIRIENTTQNTFKKVLSESEFNPTEEYTCLLKSNVKHNWFIKGCCSPDGENCGEESEWYFTTNPTPELLLPLDPNWAGTKEDDEEYYAKEVEALPITTIKWCNTITVKQRNATIIANNWPKGPKIFPENEAPYYKYERLLEERPIKYRGMKFPVVIWRLLPFIMKGEDNDRQEKCHPALTEENEPCQSLKIHQGDVKNVKIEQINEKAQIISFKDRIGLFTKLTRYRFQIQACWDRHMWGPPVEIPGGRICGDFGQKWEIETRDDPLPDFDLILPSNDPQGETPIKPSVSLRWARPPGINSFRVYFNNRFLATTSLTRHSLDDLPLNTRYSWKVRPCWDFKAEEEKCEGDAHLAGPWYFKTTGASPKLLHPKGNDIPIPIRFDWQPVGGSGSYIFKLYRNGNLLKERITTVTEISIDYPMLTQETNYSWQVKTCVYKDGTNCGAWSIQPFRTFQLSPPQELIPYDGSSVYITRAGKLFSWNRVAYANYYKYQIIFENDIIKQDIIPHANILVSLDYLKEAGKYTLRVQACLDKKCNQYGNFSESTFTIKGIVLERAPLVPCGLDHDYPGTPWDERETCQPKHLFIIGQNIINFFLWRIIPIFLVLLTLASGAIFYFSLGGKETIPFIKRLWKAFGIGLGIIFFAWLIVSFILTFLNYQVGIFGVWHQIIN